LFSLSFSDIIIFSRAQKDWRETHLLDPLVLARRAWAKVARACDDDDNDQPTTVKEAILPFRTE
jgi:hypothetical protein